MTKKQAIQLFQKCKVRTVWDDEQEKWYFSIVDVCGILTNLPDYEHARNYWKVLKHRLASPMWPTKSSCSVSPVHSIAKSRAFQAMDGSGGQSASRPDARPGVEHRALSQEQKKQKKSKKNKTNSYALQYDSNAA